MWHIKPCLDRQTLCYCQLFISVLYTQSLSCKLAMTAVQVQPGTQSHSTVLRNKTYNWYWQKDMTVSLCCFDADIAEHQSKDSLNLCWPVDLYFIIFHLKVQNIMSILCLHFRTLLTVTPTQFIPYADTFVHIYKAGNTRSGWSSWWKC